jgi:general secretion pathway protein G
MRSRSGFTLVEILIVVIILGILAAIVIPQFTNASTQARESSLKSDLQTMRSQIELYKVQHNDVVPTPLASFVNQMTLYSDIDGNTNAAKTAIFCYGPYLQQIPTNPFNNLATVVAVGASGGWEYDATTGEIHAADGGSTNEVPPVAHVTW